MRSSKINYCRLLCLQVHNLSDITNDFGLHINYCAIHHIRDPDKLSVCNSPFQPNRSKQSWKYWIKLILNSENFLLNIHIRNPPCNSPQTLYCKISTMR